MHAPTRVAIVDDTEDMRMLLRLTLAKDGRFEIVGEASNGVEAIALAERSRPDAVVLDLSMPVMDGLQALPELRRLLPDAKIAVLSGFNASQMAHEALALGADDYVEKGAAFARLIALLLESHRAADGAGETVLPAAPADPALESDRLAQEALTAVTASADLDSAFVAFCHVAHEAFAFDRASFWLVGEDKVCECAAVNDNNEGRLGVGARLSLSGRAERVLRGEPVVDADTGTDAEGTTNATLHAHGIRSTLALPLIMGGVTKAMVCFASERPNGFSKEDVPVAAKLGREVASTLHLLHLLDHERAAQTQLKKQGELKNDLVGIVAHDLRSPMTVIGGYAQYMRESWETLDEAQKLDFLDAISRNVQDVSHLVEDMLEVASLEGGPACEIQPFDLPDLIRSTVAELAVAHTGRTCTMTVPNDLPQTIGDVRRQRQILANLVSNALKFSPPDTPVDIAVALLDGACAVSVHDEGPGIAEDDLPMIFEKFYRARREGEGRVAGNGLGLYICRLLVEAQGGRIWAESRPGEGSRFTYTVRVSERATAAA